MSVQPLNVAFIILHYQNMQVTVESIEFLKRLQNISSAHIIVVDNGSPNGTGERLAEKYAGDPIVTVKLLQKNIGFASGNNKGYQFAKQQFGINCAVVMNSDVFLQDRQFLVKLQSNRDIWSKHSIIAPNVVNKEHKPLNPYLLKPKPNA